MPKPLDVLCTKWVAPVLRPRGWKRTGRTFRYFADNGDQTILAITTSSSTARPGEAVMFYVEVTAVPTTRADWMRYLNPTATRTPTIADGLNFSRIRPEPGTDWQSHKGSSFPSDDWWIPLTDPDGIDTVGAAVAKKIAAWAPHGESLTDRAKLRAELGDDDWGADGILIVDAGPSPKLDAIIKKARATGADNFADWLQTRSAQDSSTASSS